MRQRRNRITLSTHHSLRPSTIQTSTRCRHTRGTQIPAHLKDTSQILSKRCSSLDAYHLILMQDDTVASWPPQKRRPTPALPHPPQKEALRRQTPPHLLQTRLQRQSLQRLLRHGRRAQRPHPHPRRHPPQRLRRHSRRRRIAPTPTTPTSSSSASTATPPASSSSNFPPAAAIPAKPHSPPPNAK